MDDKIWIAHFIESDGSKINTACAIIRAPTKETAEIVAKNLAQTMQLPVTEVLEFTADSTIVCVHYDS